jgi:NADPH:quinone reductase-like Zn-dependent oxidoreductase
MVRSIGSDHVIDYTREDFAKNGQHYDLIYDAVGNRSVADYKRALKPQGRCVIAGFTTLPRLFEHIVVGAWMSKTGTRTIGLMGVAQPNQEDLLFVKALLEEGKVVPVIDRRYPLSETAEAIRYLEEGHAKGKVIIMIGKYHAAAGDKRGVGYPLGDADKATA